MRLLFSDVSEFAQLGQKKILQPDDFLQLPNELHPMQFRDGRGSLDLSSNLRFLISVLRPARRPIYRGLVLLFFSACFVLAGPQVLKKFIEALSSSDLVLKLAWGVSLGASAASASLLFQYYIHRILASMQMCANLLNMAIYDKSLCLNMQARNQKAVGDLINHLGSDADSVADAPMLIGDVMQAVLLMIGAIVSLYLLLGASAGLVLVGALLLLPLTSILARKLAKVDDATLAKRDHRVTLITQVLNSIRVIKFFSWEKNAEAQVTAVFGEELHLRKKMLRLEITTTAIYTSLSTLLLFAVLWVENKISGGLKLSVVFACISVMAILEAPFAVFAGALSRWMHAWVSARRLREYFLLSERAPAPHSLGQGQAVAISIQDLQVKSGERVLLDIPRLDILAGQCVAIIGPVGGGKSQLLTALLRESNGMMGSVTFFDEKGERVDPKISYTAQEPFVLNSTLLGNLSFGAIPAFSEADVQSALALCAFDIDMRELGLTLTSEIGEKGVNLSGGQKQRINLARAALRPAQLVLLDDPVSAVDPGTEQIVWDRLCWGHWKNQTRIVVTHRLDALERFDLILFIEGGRVVEAGKLIELQKQNGRFAEFYSRHLKISNDEKQTSGSSSEVISRAALGRVTEDEDREEGAVGKHVYLDYLRSLTSKSIWIAGILFFLAATAQVLPLVKNRWLTLTVDQSTSVNSLTDLHRALLVYGGLSFLVLLVTVFNQWLWIVRGLRAASNFHSRMLHSVLSTSIRFFDTTPVGRTIQRFSRDMDSLNQFIPFSMEGTVRCFVGMAVALGFVVFQIPLLLIFLVPVVYLYLRLQNAYRASAREAKRLDSISRSPKYSHFKETLMGLQWIRAFRSENWFRQEFEGILARNQRMFYGAYMLNRWFSSRVPILGSSVIALTGVLLVLSSHFGSIGIATAGLVALYAMTLLEYMNWAVRIFSEVESRMTAVERVGRFAGLPSEYIPKPPALHWPKAGQIEFKNFSARYSADGPWILKDLNLVLEPGKTYGVVGRTGSGKSTLVQSLYRFVPQTEGSIEIDGHKILDLPLEQVRRAMSIIPQDPTLFIGTLRNNLDCFGTKSDEQIWKVLADLKMDDWVHSLPAGFFTEVHEGGLNFSQGQRQLICLARAIINNSQILIMDEATASIDVELDEKIQTVLRSLRGTCTQLIIAHRLETLRSVDGIVVVASGKAKLKTTVLSETPDQLASFLS